jgi:hypothetical protein
MLNCVADEFFVSPQTWKDVFEPYGIPCRPLIRYRRGDVVDDVVQLVFDRYVDIDTTGLPSKVCAVCGRVRYDMVRRGFQPEPLYQNGHAFKSNQWFGAGGLGYQMVLVTAELYRRIKEAGIRPITWEPCGGPKLRPE